MFLTSFFELFVLFFLMMILPAFFLLEGQMFFLVVFMMFLFLLWFFFARKNFFRLFLIGAIAFFCALLRLLFFLDLPENSLIDFLQRKADFELKACIVDEPDVRFEQVRYFLKFDDYEGKLLWVAPRYPLYGFGDCFLLRGRLEKIKKFSNFAYDNYLRRFGVLAEVKNVVVVKIFFAEEGSFWREIYDFKSIFQKKINTLFGEPQAGFLSGLLLGARQGIDPELMDAFNVTGLTHVIAISGYNISLLIVLMFGFFSFLSLRWRIFFSLSAITLFVIFVGMSAAVVRAGIMGGISLLALYFGRQYFVVWALLSAAFLMTLWNPFILLFDAGFQLSFLATAGLVFLADRLQKIFEFVPNFLALRDALVLTLAAQIFALPILIFNFGAVSLISPVANFFVLPLMPLAMLFGFLAVVVAPFFGLIAFVLLDLAAKVAIFLAKIPYAQWQLF